jgi:periplasmic divalent cation tolerance protein
VTDIVLVLATVPSADRGEAMARALVSERLAACVNVLPPMTSFYRWKGAVERDTECQLVVKTTRDRVAGVAARIRELHTYELPELLVLTVDDGAAAYLDWIRAATRPHG